MVQWILEGVIVLCIVIAILGYWIGPIAYLLVFGILSITCLGVIMELVELRRNRGGWGRSRQ